jgi:hypothetical protein
LGLAKGWLGVGGLGVGRLNIVGLGVGGFGAGGLGVDMKWYSSRHRFLLRAMALHVARTMGRSLRFSAFLSVRPKIISEHPNGRGCTFERLLHLSTTTRKAPHSATKEGGSEKKFDYLCLF